MQIGVIGLGRMGANISRRLMRAGHSCVVWDANAACGARAWARKARTAVGSLQAVGAGAEGKPRAVWVMLPAGRITEQTIAQLGDLMDSGDIIIDGGNTYLQGRCPARRRRWRRRASAISIAAPPAACGGWSAATA